MIFDAEGRSNVNIIEENVNSEVIGSEDFSLPLKHRIIYHIANSKVILKSQQKHEPDLTLKERNEIAAELLKRSPSQFLYRFGKNLEREHLQYFAELPTNPEIDFYLQETQKILNEATRRTTIKNRRYAALRKLQSSSSYFSEEEMEKRDPLLYEELVGKNLTDEEKNTKNKLDCNSFSEVLFECMDRKNLKTKQSHQIELETDAIEEFDEDSSEEEEMKLDDFVDQDTKQFMKNEFQTSLYSQFLRGKDKEFDYSSVDDSEEYDMLDVLERDEEERYFDED